MTTVVIIGGGAVGLSCAYVLAQQGLEVTLKNPAELAAHLQKERDELVPLIRSLGLKPE